MLTKQIGPLVWEVHSPTRFRLPGFNIWLMRDSIGWALAEAKPDGTDTFVNVPDRDTGSHWLYCTMREMGGRNAR